jgi:16S rRNA (uracil1498-N3)-methyltransferase
MALPFFYISSYDPAKAEIALDEDNSRHIVQVLRMKAGEPLQLTDGRGALLRGVIAEAHKKKCVVQVQHAGRQPGPPGKIAIAISLLKNANRFEWFLEKATEIGVGTIIPLLCERTEKQHFRQDRMQNILVSAMLQSQQCWLPELQSPAVFSLVAGKAVEGRRFIAHCLEEEKISLAEAQAQTGMAGADGTIILIGPEGDFSPKEIELALQNKFLPVTLGATRLRSETAGMVAAALLCIR